MAQTRGSLIQLHDNTDRQVFVMLNQQLKKLPPGWREYFKVEQSSRMTEIAMNIVGFGDVPEKPEGEAYVTNLLKPGHEKRVTHTEFGMGFEVT
jgi:predicted ATP-dependent Lon-type protease